MTNCYPALATMLGVVLGEEFRLKARHAEPYPAKYKITSDGLMYCYQRSVSWSNVGTNLMQTRIFCALLRGDVEVVK